MNWSTLTLFELIIIQYFWEMLTKKTHIRNNNKIYHTTSFCLAVILYTHSLPTISAKLDDISLIIGVPMLRYCLYFFIGSMIRNNLNTIYPVEL